MILVALASLVLGMGLPVTAVKSWERIARAGAVVLLFLPDTMVRVLGFRPSAPSRVQAQETA